MPTTSIDWPTPGVNRITWGGEPFEAITTHANNFKWLVWVLDPAGKPAVTVGSLLKWSRDGNVQHYTPTESTSRSYYGPVTQVVWQVTNAGQPTLSLVLVNYIEPDDDDD